MNLTIEQIIYGETIHEVCECYVCLQPWQVGLIVALLGLLGGIVFYISLNLVGVRK